MNGLLNNWIIPVPGCLAPPASGVISLLLSGHIISQLHFYTHTHTPAAPYFVGLFKLQDTHLFPFIIRPLLGKSHPS